MFAGAAVGGLVNLAAQRSTPGARTDWLEVGAMTAVGAGLGLLADILEPATSPNHRKLFHSFLFIGLLIWCFTRLWNREPRSDQQRRTWPILLLAFLSHHFLDALTKRSLPWLGFRL